MRSAAAPFGSRVQAAYQGEIATAEISQTNFATASAAAQAGAAVGAGGSTVAAAGGATGGGISGTTIAIVGAAVGGGALAATQLAGSSDGNGDAGGNTPPAGGSGGGNSNVVTFTGPLNGQLVFTQTSGSSTCVSTRAIVGTLTIQLRDGNSTGSAGTDGSQTEVSFTQSPTCSPVSTVPFNNNGLPVTGGPATLAFSTQTSFTGPTPSGGSVTATNTLAFSGRFEGGAITGTLTYTLATRGNSGTNDIAGNGSTTMAVTLR